MHVIDKPDLEGLNFQNNLKVIKMYQNKLKCCQLTFLEFVIFEEGGIPFKILYSV